MALTPAQLSTLKTYITNTPALAAIPPGSDGDWAIALLINETAAPAFAVWRSDVSIDEIQRNGMNWTLCDNLSVGRARIWDWLGRLGRFDAGKANVRAGIDACWAGAGAEFVAQRASIYSHCKRSATVAEKLFATGTGSDASPATMVIEGAINYQDVGYARMS